MYQDLLQANDRCGNGRNTALLRKAKEENGWEIKPIPEEGKEAGLLMKISKENISEAGLKAQAKCRDRVNLIRQRLSMLSGEEKVLMTMYWENGNSLRQISKLAGLNRRSIARRIHKITERLMEGEYIDCLRYRNKFTHSEMTIAKDYFLRGISMKKIADKRHLSFYHVRKTLEKIHQILATLSNESSECKPTDYKN
jgi:predicted DNA-binding protein YlxM (UPF0122 family)